MNNEEKPMPETATEEMLRQTEDMHERQRATKPHRPPISDADLNNMFRLL